MVIHLNRVPLSARANSSFVPVKRPFASLPFASLADELNVRATAALVAAREMPPGVRRAKAMNEAMILRNAVEMHEHFLGRGDAPARCGPVGGPFGSTGEMVPRMRAFK